MRTLLYKPYFVRQDGLLIPAGRCFYVNMLTLMRAYNKSVLNNTVLVLETVSGHDEIPAKKVAIKAAKGNEWIIL